MTIVLAWAPGPLGQAVLDAGASEALARKARVVLVNAVSGDALVAPAYATDDDVQLARQQLETQGIECQVVHKVTGRDVSDSVLDVIDDEHAALLVVGLRRRSPVGKLIMGSVAQRLLLDAPCPVLAVKEAS